MLEKGIKVLFLLSWVLFINACDNNENQQQTENKAQSKSSEKTILIECKATQKEGAKFFNATIEILPMTDEILTKVHKLETQEEFSKSELPIYARVKNTELIDKKSSIKDSCINSTLFYGDTPLDKVSSTHEIKLSSISKNCNYGIFLANKELTLLQPSSNPPKKVEDAPFVSSCQIVKN